VLLSLVLSLMGAGAGWAAEPESKARTSLYVWDTGKPSADAWSGRGVIGKNDWTVIPVEKTATFQGDAVFSNSRVAAAFRKHSASVELYGVRADGATVRSRLRLLTAAGEPAARLQRATLVENTKNAISIEAVYQTAKGVEAAAKFRLRRGDVHLQVEPGSGAARLRVESPSRFVVLPDFFADDIVLDSTQLSLESVDLPSENFVLHLTGQGNAITMCIFEYRQQDVQIALSGAGGQRMATGSTVGFENKKIWVAILEAPNIWHSAEIKAADAGKVMPLEWRMPFLAQYRVDFMRGNDLTDSWEMLLQEPRDGSFIKPSWLGSGDDHVGANRKRWNTVLGSYPYPCWSDISRNGYLQPLKSRVLQFQGPAVIYPINRVKQTPLDFFTVVDMMRNTLGVGPCEHILDLEGQKSEYKGRATCGVRDKLTPIYQKGQQKQLRSEVDKTLDEGLAFVTHIRGRITRYVEFGHKMRSYLAEQKKAHPDLSKFIDEMDQIAQEIDTRYAARADNIKTPAHVAQMNEDFRKNVLTDDGPSAVEKCRQYTRALVVIGDNQDELSGECRWVVKTLRQRAGIRVAMDPRVAPIAAEIRARTQEALRNPANHEGARH
jgi:hypothetical protein